jgi:hypothetical protein
MLNTPAWARTWSVLRLLMAATILAAIIAQLMASMSRSIADQTNTVTVIANFFSFFTILSNAGSVIVLAWAAIWYFRRNGHERVEPRGLAIALASVTTYMIVTGIVYNLLLRDIELPQGSRPIPWSNETLHVIGPIFLLLDLLLGPLRRRLPWRNSLLILVFPIVWVVYTLIRGPLVTNPVSGNPFWYPYPFLDPHNFDNGFGGVAVYIVGIAIGILAVGALVVWVGRRRGARLTAEEAATGSAEGPMRAH